MTHKETRNAEYWRLRAAPPNPKTTIAEALEALLVMAEHPVASISARRAAYTTIRSALTDAAAETEFWRVIEGWNGGKRIRTALVAIALLTEDKAAPMTFVGSDRESFAKCLASAADWIKKEGEK